MSILVRVLGLTALELAVLKLAGAITWPWLWVMLPIWGGVLAVTLAIAVAGVVLIGWPKMMAMAAPKGVEV